eukprot:3899129-Amphidinium_carterae.1
MATAGSSAHRRPPRPWRRSEGIRWLQASGGPVAVVVAAVVSAAEVECGTGGCWHGVAAVVVAAVGG